MGERAVIRRWWQKKALERGKLIRKQIKKKPHKSILEALKAKMKKAKKIRA